MDANKGKDDKAQPGEGGGDEDALSKPQLNALDSLSAKEGGEDIHLAPDEQGKDGKKPKGKNPIKKLWGMLNVYLLIFMLLVVIAGIVFAVTYLNSQKQPKVPSTALQNLTQQQLSQIASGGDATVGDPKYVLSIQSDAIFAGNALVRGDLSVAGNIQLGKALSVPTLTVSGESNLATVQINTLSVQGATVLQGNVTFNSDATIDGQLNVKKDVTLGRSLNVSGVLTVPSITTANLTLAGNGNLTINNHLNVSGPTPGRSQGSAVGSGGSTNVSGSDTAGTVNINTGNSPSVGCFATISFVQKYNGQPQVIVTPVGSAAGSLDWYVDRSSTSFSVCTANTPQAGKTFAFDYFVTN